jgi:hypothetical protein
MKNLRSKLTYANVISTLCLFLLLGGGAAVAASQLGKNSVGTKQLKKHSVTTAKIKKQAITAAKVKNGTLTGTQINASTLGTVPTAQTANSVVPPEGWHLVGAAGEPGFESSWENVPAGPPFAFESAGFYKDREGVVHLKGVVKGGPAGIIFHLPAGYRPASGKVLVRLTICSGVGCTESTGGILIAGPGVAPNADGAVLAPSGATTTSLEEISFRAES